MELFPWLAPAAIEKALALEDPEGEEDPPAPVHAGAPPEEMADDVVDARLEDAADRLRDLRDEYAAEDDDDLPELHFYVRILGGKWTVLHKDVDADAATMFARQHAKRWCHLFHWALQKGFAFSAYGQAESVHLAKAWARKGNYFCDIWYAAGAADEFEYSHEQLASYVEQDTFLDWAVTVDIELPTFERIVQVRTDLPHKGLA